MVLASVVLLGGCTGDDVDRTPSSGAEADSTSGPDAEQVEQDGRIVEAGFVQDGDIVQTITLVENTATTAGQDVTLISEYLDADGNSVGSETVVTAFNFPGQTIAMVGGGAVRNASVEVVSVESELIVDPADGNVSEVDFGSVEGENLRQERGNWVADFTVTNPTSAPLKSPDVAVACRDASGVINGGGIDFPDVVPANGEASISPILIVDGDPAECTAYISDPI